MEQIYTFVGLLKTGYIILNHVTVAQ